MSPIYYTIVQKNHYGFPRQAIECVMDQAGIRPHQIDRVAMSTKKLIPAYFYTGRNSRLSVLDYWKEQKEYWYPKLYENKKPKSGSYRGRKSAEPENTRKTLLENKNA